MCGIAGYINKNQCHIRDTSCIMSMLKVQKHRGPDDSGIRAFNIISKANSEYPVQHNKNIDENFNAIFGFNRLSILDLSINGHQPMLNQDKNVILMMNGEIYNAFDLKPELESYGFAFRSTTDTEVVLNLYIKFGIYGLLSRLNGMFAIAIADLRIGKIYLIRDRFGIKPLYFIDTAERLAFSSEIKSFEFISEFKFELNENKLDEYLIYRSNIEDTIFKNVKSILPGHYLEYSVNAKIIQHTYFDINSYIRKPKNHDLTKNITLIETLLEKSVQSQLMSDVKLGCQLSGGVDSSLVTYLANESNKKGQFETVSIVFNEKKYTEKQYIDLVTKKIKVESHNFLMDSEYYLNNIKKVTWHFEAPINHPNTIGIFFLAQRAKEYVTVLLSGEGADEIFGGYSHFYNVVYPFLSTHVLRHIKYNFFPLHDLVRYLNPPYRAINATAHLTPSYALNLKPDFKVGNAMNQRLSLYNSLTGSVFDKQVKYEMKTYLPDILIRQDKMSMANSIESRVPFLDNNVVEGAFSLPRNHLIRRSSFKIKNTEKFLIKKIAEKHFGEDFAFRKKMGFQIPLRNFFIDKRFDEFINDQIMPGIESRGIFNYSCIKNWVSDIGKISNKDIEALWIMISFELWAQTFLTKK
jgi:asparagine synthase (glutamine-hydrolysing)